MHAYPLELRFKLLAIASQIAVTDATGRLLFYVKQKAFKLKEAVTVFADEAQRTPLYKIAADRVIDISARYHISREGGGEVGVLQRRGMRSFWRAHYDIHRDGRPVMLIREENPWVKVLDGFVGELPIIGIFTGYMLHPAYAVTRATGAAGDQPGEKLLRVVKRPALFEGRYQVERAGSIDGADEELASLAIVMMLLLERARG
jgi:hypothetical protein